MTGGVCAVLNYEVDMMAEYVTEMSMRLALQTTHVPDSYRQFISQILTSTRLPSTTILLGLNYFAKRINTMNAYNPGNVNITEGHVWRLMTVALLLGSKFLDDNTFQNRSWADVSGIPVRELNNLEREWMEAIGWGLYVNLDRSEDYTAWINSWADWEALKKRQLFLARRERFSLAMAVSAATATPAPAIEVDYFRHRNAACADMAYADWYQLQVNEYERLSQMKRNEQAMQHQQHQQQQQQQHQYDYRQYQHDYRAYEQPGWYHPPSYSWSRHPQPGTPPDSGYGTPEYMSSEETVAPAETVASSECVAPAECVEPVSTVSPTESEESVSSEGSVSSASSVESMESLESEASVSTVTASTRMAWFDKRFRGAVGGGCSQHGGKNQTYFQARNAAMKRPAYNVYGHDNIWVQSADHGRHRSYFCAPHSYGQPVLG